MIPPCLTLSNIRYISRVKWSNPGKGVALSSTPWCSSYWKGSLLISLDYDRQLYFYLHQGVREGAIFYPRLLHFPLDVYLITLSVQQGSIKYHFWVFSMTTWDWTTFTPAIGKHSTHWANGLGEEKTLH